MEGKSGPPSKTPEELARSRAAHYAALLFNNSADAYPASDAMQAIHVSLAYRQAPRDVSLSEMSQWLRADTKKIENIIKLGRIRHANLVGKPHKGWENEVPDIIESVFRQAEMLLSVEDGVLRPYLSFYPSIIEDLRKPSLEQKGREIEVRLKLARLAHAI